MTNMTKAFEVEGLVQQKKKLEELMMTNPEMEKKVKGIIQKVLSIVRKHLQDHAKGALNSDPREAHKAVKYAVYRQVLGGSVSILNRKKAGEGRDITPPRNPSQRGGNRRERSARTKALQSYYGADRAFILRFINNGADNRSVKFKTNDKRKTDKWNKNPNTGNRGSITARNFFDGDAQIKLAAEQISALIDELIKEELE